MQRYLPITVCKIRRLHITDAIKFLHEFAYQRWTFIIGLYIYIYVNIIMSVPRYGVSTQEQKEHRLLTEYNY